MKGLIVGTGKTNGLNLYKVILFDYVNKEWKFNKQVVNEAQLVTSISNRAVDMLNAKVENGKVKGKTGSLSRFENAVNKPLVVIAELVTEGQGVIGYKVASADGVVKNIALKEFLAYCKRVTKNDGIPVQNGMYVGEADGQKDHIRCYPGGDFLKEVIERKKSANARPAQVNTNKNEKAIAKIEELFNKDQIKELKLGKQQGVNIKVYGDTKLSADQMKVIREGLVDGIDASVFADPAYSVDSMRILRADMKYGVDVSYYLNPKYSAEQLSELSSGFISGVDVSKYADPAKSPEEMAEIRMRLEHNIWKEVEVKEQNLI